MLLSIPWSEQISWKASNGIYLQSVEEFIYSFSLQYSLKDISLYFHYVPDILFLWFFFPIYVG